MPAPSDPVERTGGARRGRPQGGGRRPSPAPTASTWSPRSPRPSPTRRATGRFRVVAYDFGIKRAILRHLGQPGHGRGGPGVHAGGRGAGPPAGRGVPLQRPGRPGRRSATPPTPSSSCSARCRSSGSASATSCMATALGGQTYKLPVRPPRRQPPGAPAGDQRGRDHQPEPQLRGGRRHRSPAVDVTHVNLNDGVIEGIACRDVPAFSVQYHPEAGPGPARRQLPVRRVPACLIGDGARVSAPAAARPPTASWSSAAARS